MNSLLEKISGMGIFQYESGDCGWGYKGSIMAANAMVWLSFVPIMLVMLSWITFGVYGIVFIPLVYENVFSIPAWIMGTFCTIPGIYAMFIENDKRRVSVLNLWVVLIFVFTVLIIGAGIYWVVFIATNNDITVDCVKEVVRMTGRRASDFGVDTSTTPGAFSRAGDRLATLGKGIMYFEIYTHLSYPWNALFFLHWQLGVTAVTFCVIPSIMALWALYHALGNRNYFAKMPSEYKDQAIISGPIWEDEESRDHHSESDQSFDSEEEDNENRQATKPLTRRHQEYSEPVDAIRVNPAAARVVQGHCGYCGVGGVIVTISTVILVFTGISAAAIILIGMSDHGVGILTAAITYNLMGPITWASGFITGVFGFVIAASSNSKSRGSMLTLWMVMMVVHTGMVLAYGIVILRDLSQIYLLHDDLMQGAFSETIPRVKPDSEKLKELLSPGGKLYDAFNQGSASMILHYAPFPLNLVFFMGLRMDLSGMVFIALPVAFMMMSLPFVMAIRHYFISTKEGVVNHRAAYEDTPLTAYMCSDPPSSKYGEESYSDTEEDLASTFDGDYTGRESFSEYDSAESISSGPGSKRPPSQETIPLIR